MSQSQAIESNVSHLSESERESVMRKIKRCLALGSSSNPTEAETAMRQAQALMRKYRLREIDIEVDSVRSELRSTGLSRLAGWQRDLAGTCATAFNCQLITSYRKREDKTFMFIGVMPSAELAAYAYDSLLQQVKAARKQFTSKYKVSRRQADDFCIAWVLAVYQKVASFAQDNPTQTASESGALMVVESREKAAIDAWIDRTFNNVKERKPQTRHVDAYAFAHGKQAGAAANIHQAVHGQAGGQLRIA